ncbi:MAG: AAA family ATPase [Desulfosarcina sp.]|jgi:general secretion pathway protein A
MYNRFFGFKERPFKLVPNPEFVYLSRVHEEVLAHLNYAAGFGEGFVAITGEVGTGKTTLCRMFLERLDENTPAAYIFNPTLNALQLLKTINDEYGIDSDTDSVKILIDRLNAFLLEQKAQGKRVILLVDEAQNLSADVLEQLRLLSNLETTTSKLLQIILVGQPELGELLETEALRQLNQRITLSCHLVPLSQTETREYIRHRIHIASQKPGLEFTASAHRSIFRYTGGVPRLINIACERALLTAFTLGSHRITNRIVKRALRELDSRPSRSESPLLRREKLIIGLLSVLVILVAGLVVGQAMLNHSGRPAAAPVVHHKIETPPPSTTSDPATPEAAKPVSQEVVAPPAPVASAADPEASVTPPPAPPIPAPVAQVTRDLASVIAAADVLHSRDQALAAVLSAWNGPSKAGPADVLDNKTFFRIAARQNGMQALRVKGNLNLIRKLNLPAIVEFAHADGGVRFLAVLGLSEADIRLSDGQADFSTPHATMQAKWSGVAHILWKDFFNYTGVIPITSPGEVIIALKVHLKGLGFSIGEMNAAYDTLTRQAVETIQARNGLDVDGVVGPQTKIALYNMDASLDIPRLVGFTVN